MITHHQEEALSNKDKAMSQEEFDLALSLWFLQEPESSLLAKLRHGLALRAAQQFPRNSKQQENYTGLVCDLLRGTTASVHVVPHNNPISSNKGETK